MSMPSSSLFRYLLAVLILLTLWAGCAGDQQIGDPVDSNLIELSLDTLGDDPADRDAPIPQAPLAHQSTPTPTHLPDRLCTAVPSRPLPPDHPPPETV